MDLRLDTTPLSKGELNDAAHVAVRGFYTDPFFRFLSPNGRQRSRGLFFFFRTALRHLGPKGEIVTVRNADNHIVGVAAWMAPGGYPQPVATQLAAIPGSFRALYRRPKALLLGNRYLAAVARAHPKEPHWYLYLLVADPEMQRRGVGKMLLDYRVAQIDADGLGSYLETQKEENLAYYGRFGFELVKPLTPVEGGPPIYTLWRPAKSN